MATTINGSDIVTGSGFDSSPASLVPQVCKRFYLATAVTADTSNMDWAVSGITGFPHNGSISASSGVFSFTETGVYQVSLNAVFSITPNDSVLIDLEVSNDGGSTWVNFATLSDGNAGTSLRNGGSHVSSYVNVTDINNQKVRFRTYSISSGSLVQSGANTTVTFIKISEAVA